MNSLVAYDDSDDEAAPAAPAAAPVAPAANGHGKRAASDAPKPKKKRKVLKSTAMLPPEIREMLERGVGLNDDDDDDDLSAPPAAASGAPAADARKREARAPTSSCEFTPFISPFRPAELLRRSQ